MKESDGHSSAKAGISHLSGPMAKLAYVNQLARTIADREAVSVPRQFAEMAYLYVTRRLGPLLYYEQALWQPRLSLRQKQKYLNEAQYLARIQALNPPPYQKFSQHKLVEKSILRLLGVPTAEFIGYLHHTEGSDSQFNPLTNASQLAQLLQRHPDDRICFKLSEGWGGRDFIAAQTSQTGGETRLQNLSPDATALEVDSFYNTYLAANTAHGLVIERYIEQHDALKKLNTSSLNTLRIWLLQKDAEVRLIGAILRIGRAGKLVDNASQGGMLAKVDLDTGRLEKAKTAEVFPTYFSHHPDSGAAIEQMQLPHWEACKKLAKECLRVFPRATFVGLDLAIGPAGPVVVELNLEPDRISARNFGAPLADLLTW